MKERNATLGKTEKSNNLSITHKKQKATKTFRCVEIYLGKVETS